MTDLCIQSARVQHFSAFINSLDWANKINYDNYIYDSRNDKIPAKIMVLSSMFSILFIIV